jgi:hypothetical protein
VSDATRTSPVQSTLEKFQLFVFHEFVFHEFVFQLFVFQEFVFALDVLLVLPPGGGAGAIP